MANFRREVVGYKKLNLQPIQPEGLLAVARAGGELEQKVANFMFRVADQAGLTADRQAEAAGERAGRQAALARRPGRMQVTDGSSATEMAGGTPARRQVNLSGDRQKFIDTLMPAAIEASRRTGVDPRIIVAQAAQETGWGRAAPGNNYFGIKSHGKAGGQTFTTHEVIDGKRVKIQDSFRSFASPEDSVAGYADFILQNPRYSNFRGTQGLDAQLSALQASGYATDPNYSNSVGAIARSIAFMPNAQAAASAPAAQPTGEAAAAPKPSAAPSAQQVAAPAVVTRLPGDGETFQVSGRDTVYGRAYDAAGTRTFLQLLDSEIRSTTAQAFRLHENDPAQLSVTLETLKRAQLRDDVPEEIRAEYEVAFDAAAQRYIFQAHANADRQQKEANIQAFEHRSLELGTDIERMLQSFDPELPGVENSIAEAQIAIDDHYDTAVANGVMTWQQAETGKVKSRSDTAVRFYLRQASALDPDELVAMREAMQAEFKAGGLQGLTDAGWQKLEIGLKQAEANAKGEAAAIVRDVEKEGTRLADRALAGFDITQEELNRFVIEAGKSGEDSLVAAALMKIDAAEAIRDLPLREAARHIEKMRAGLAKDASDAEIAAVAFAEERLQKLAELAEKDPVAYEIQRGRLTLEPIALDSEEAMDASLAIRRDQMRAVAERFGRDVPYFRSGEVSALSRAIIENPEAFPDFAASIASVFGADAKKVLAEIGPEMPTLAHAAAIMVATGDRSLAVDLAQAISAKQKGEWKAKMPSEQRFAATALPMLGSSLSFMDGTRANVLGAAQLLLERDGNLLGFDPDEVHKPESIAHASLKRALNRALGAQLVGGETTGGLGEINGSSVIVPTGMTERAAAGIVQSLDATDLASLPAIASVNGVEISPDQLRYAKLVTVDDGVYRVALGDPHGWDPQYVLGENGELWTLDLNAIEANRRNRPVRRNRYGFLQPGLDE